VSLHIGASLDPSSTPVDTKAEVVFLLEHDNPLLREAVVRIGGIDLVLTVRRRPFHNIADFTKLGLDPRTAKIVAVKSGYLSPELGPIANPGIMALSPGVVDQFVERTVRNHTPRPSFPFDRDFALVPTLKWSALAK
jgi:microcystin degradation protein MlrC